MYLYSIGLIFRIHQFSRSWDFLSPKMNQHLGFPIRIEIEHSEYSSRTYSLGTSSLRAWLIKITHRYSAWRVLSSTMSWWLRLSLDSVPKFNFQMSIYSWKLKIRKWKTVIQILVWESNLYSIKEWINEKLIQWNIQKWINYWFSVNSHVFTIFHAWLLMQH